MVFPAFNEYVFDIANLLGRIMFYVRYYSSLVLHGGVAYRLRAPNGSTRVCDPRNPDDFVVQPCRNSKRQ